jgi:CRP-like cAMP-binding protein
MIDEHLAAALRTAMNDSLSNQHIRNMYAQWEGYGKRLVHYPCNTFIVHTEDPVEHILILLEGRCQVLNHNSDGKIIMAGNVKPPQIFGLYELLAGLCGHTADVQTQTDCLVFSVSAKLYTQQIAVNGNIAAYSAQYLAFFIQRLLDRSDRMTLHTDRQNLLWYILESCRGKAFPVILSVHKETMAAELNMNVRTLYRKIGQLRNEGLVESHKGKIKIGKEQYLALQRQAYKNI